MARAKNTEGWSDDRFSTEYFIKVPKGKTFEFTPSRLLLISLSAVTVPGFLSQNCLRLERLALPRNTNKNNRFFCVLFDFVSNYADYADMTNKPTFFLLLNFPLPLRVRR
jgi:hypothetical protein